MVKDENLIDELVKEKSKLKLQQLEEGFNKEQIAKEVEQLEKKYQKKAIEKGPDCSVCAENEADTVIVGCGHVVCSETCLKKINGKCPFCRGPADKTCKLFFG
jgi:hypothetical protein